MADKGKLKQKDMVGLTIYLEPERFEEFKIILSYLKERNIDIHNEVVADFIDKKKKEDPEIGKLLKLVKTNPALAAMIKGKKS